MALISRLFTLAPRQLRSKKLMDTRLKGPAFGEEAINGSRRSGQVQVATTSFLTLFSIVGLALYGLPFYYDFMVKEFGWSSARVTSGNALSKFLIGPIFGFVAGWVVDRFGPRRLMMAGIVMAGTALIGLSAMSALWMFYFFYLFNA